MLRFRRPLPLRDQGLAWEKAWLGSSVQVLTYIPRWVGETRTYANLQIWRIEAVYSLTIVRQTFPPQSSSVSLPRSKKEKSRDRGPPVKWKIRAEIVEVPSGCGSGSPAYVPLNYCTRRRSIGTCHVGANRFYKGCRADKIRRF